jgi:hypothetical protein
VRLVIIHRDSGEWSTFNVDPEEPCWAMSRELARTLDKLWRGWRIVTLDAAREDYALRVP